MRSAEAARLWNAKRGSRVLENADKKSDEKEEEKEDVLENRRAESSLSLRLCVALEERASSRILAIFCINCFPSSASVIFTISMSSSPL